MHKKSTTTLDRLDLRILARYQHDTQVPARTIGEAVGLSTAAVQRRLKRMRESGVIEREVAQLAPSAVGMPLTCIVSVDLDREQARDIDRFRRRMAACPEVQQCYYVTGQADFILVVLTPDMQSYEAFTRRNLLDDGNVRSFTTHAVLEPVKVGVTVNLAEALEKKATRESSV
jgi:Lrp/AsnC family transcriptional regulator, leucine-responsive regulatory protein